jgi:hypothetical protein
MQRALRRAGRRRSTQRWPSRPGYCSPLMFTDKNTPDGEAAFRRRRRYQRYLRSKRATTPPLSGYSSSIGWSLTKSALRARPSSAAAFAPGSIKRLVSQLLIALPRLSYLEAQPLCDLPHSLAHLRLGERCDVCRRLLARRCGFASECPRGLETACDPALDVEERQEDHHLASERHADVLPKTSPDAERDPQHGKCESEYTEKHHLSLDRRHLTADGTSALPAVSTLRCGRLDRDRDVGRTQRSLTLMPTQIRPTESIHVYAERSGRPRSGRAESRGWRRSSASGSSGRTKHSSGRSASGVVGAGGGGKCRAS